MIKPGSLVRIEPKYYPITHSVISHANLIGMVLETELNFYKLSVVPHRGTARHYILWGNETYSYEPDTALVEVLPDED